MTNIEALIAAAEEASRLWRLGKDKAKRPEREIINDLDAAITACKKEIARDSTRVIHRDPPSHPMAGE